MLTNAEKLCSNTSNDAIIILPQSYIAEKEAMLAKYYMVIHLRAITGP